MVLFLLGWQATFRIPNLANDVAFKFMSTLLTMLSKFSDNARIGELATVFPESLLKAHKFEDILRDNWQKMIVCSKCYSTYEYDDQN